MAHTAPFNPCTVVVDDVLSQQLKIYPNPSSGKYRLESNHPVALGAMKVMDTQGKVVRTYGEFREVLDLTDLDTGIYFLSVRSGEHLLNRKREKIRRQWYPLVRPRQNSLR